MNILALALALIDLGPYRTVPLLSATGTVSLGKSLLALRLPNTPAYVEKDTKKLELAIENAEAQFAERHDAGADLGLERSFDVLVDRIWVALRSRLQFWLNYDHEGIELFSDDERDELELAEARELAVVAAELLARVFGEGVEFLRLPYPRQAAEMASRLRYIETHGYGAVFEELVGARPAAFVKVCQRRYEAMVEQRDARPDGVTINLRLLRDDVKRAIERYANAVLTLIDDDDPEQSQAVLAALHPLIAVRTRKLRIPTPAESPAPDADADIEQDVEQDVVEHEDLEQELVEQALDEAEN